MCKIRLKKNTMWFLKIAVVAVAIGALSLFVMHVQPLKNQLLRVGTASRLLSRYSDELMHTAKSMIENPPQATVMSPSYKRTPSAAQTEMDTLFNGMWLMSIRVNSSQNRMSVHFERRTVSPSKDYDGTHLQVIQEVIYCEQELPCGDSFPISRDNTVYTATLERLDECWYLATYNVW